MDSNMTFRIDSEVKAQMAAICDALGMSTSTAFNIFANASPLNEPRTTVLPLIFLPMPLFEQKACLLLSRFRSL